MPDAGEVIALRKQLTENGLAAAVAADELTHES